VEEEKKGVGGFLVRQPARTDREEKKGGEAIGPVLPRGGITKSRKGGKEKADSESSTHSLLAGGH